DSCLRFSLEENNSVWITRAGITGHSLLLDNLKAGNSYTLKVWYALQPENAVTYRITVAPFWYQRGRYQLLLGILTAGVVGLVLYFFIKRRERKSTLKLQQARHAFASVRSQLNPHFIFNALSSIQSLINANNVTKANDYLSRFSKLLRTSLQPDYQAMVPLSAELELLQQYIELEQLRLPFRFMLLNDPLIDTHAIEIPGMLLQPIAENAIKHGLAGADSPELICEIRQQNSDLQILLKNNGTPVKNNYRKGMGLQLIEEKIDILNTCFPGTNGKFELTAGNQITIASITLHQWMK
ncbi:MAG: sensor histidine kinase, partial [Chitinophagaceae bacterium]|nr:sensor histidine kinase [Chitinophagaceae bacterium]